MSKTFEYPQVLLEKAKKMTKKKKTKGEEK